MNEFVVDIANNKHSIKFVEELKLVFNEEPIEIDFSKINEHVYLLKIEDKVYDITVVFSDRDKLGFLIAGNYIELKVKTKLRDKAEEVLKNKSKENHLRDLTSPMPGLLLKILKAEGDEVKLGDNLVVLEAMKMENNLKSPATGKIKKIFKKPGSPVEKDDVILSIE